MADVISSWEFNAAWAIIFWMQVLLVPYGIWLGLRFLTLAKGIGLGLLIAVYGGVITFTQGHSFAEVISLKETSTAGRVIVLAYGLILAGILVAIGKSIVGLFRRHTAKYPSTGSRGEQSDA